MLSILIQTSRNPSHFIKERSGGGEKTGPKSHHLSEAELSPPAILDQGFMHHIISLPASVRIWPFRAPCFSFPHRDIVLVQMVFGGWGRGMSLLLIQQLLSSFYMSSTVLGARNTAVSPQSGCRDSVGVNKIISE